MSEAAAPVAAAPVATPATPAPAATSTPAVVDTRGASLSFAEEMAQFGGFDGDGEVAETPKPSPPPKAKGGKKGKASAAAAAESATPAEPAAPAPTSVPTPAERRATLVEIAKELGLDVDDARVTTRERAEFREARRQHAERMKRDEQDFMQRLNGLKTETVGEVQWARQLKQLRDAGDYEGIARHLGAKDWNGLQEEVIARISDPNYKKLRELEEFKQQQIQREEQTRREREQQEASAREVAARRQYMGSLSQLCSASKDPLVAAMHDDPMFLQAVYDVQKENWDGRTTVTPEQAIKIVSRNAARPLAQELRGIYERLHKAFGATPPAAAVAAAKAEVAEVVAAAATPAPTAGKANKTGVVPSKATPEASPPRKLTKKELDEQFTRRIQEAIEEDRRTG